MCEIAEMTFRKRCRILIPKGNRGEKKGMFGRRKVMLEVTPAELRIIRKVMLVFRNRVLAEGKPAEDIDRVILKLCR